MSSVSVFNVPGFRKAREGGRRMSYSLCVSRTNRGLIAEEA